MSDNQSGPLPEGAQLVGRKMACRRGLHSVFESLSFCCPSASAMVVRGDNGAGKTSLLRQIAGFLHLDDGEIGWESQNAHDGPLQPIRTSDVHYLGHLNGLKPVLTVRETLAFDARLFGAQPTSLPLTAFGLDAIAELPVGHLSAGQQRRVSLSRLLLFPRRLWLLDEPSIGLDASSKASLWQAVSAHVSAGGLAVISSHEDVPVAPQQTLSLSTKAEAA